MVRRAVGEGHESDLRQGVVHPTHDLVRSKAELSRAEGDVLPHRAAKKLVIGVLKQKARAAADGRNIFSRHSESFNADLSVRCGKPLRQDAVQVVKKR
jgi:hypothetical protein